MRLLLLRHGIAADAAPTGRDADRALTRDGVEELERVARALVHAELACDRVVSSPYRRAVETARLVADAVGHQGDVPTAEELVPEADVQETLAFVRGLRGAKCALLVGHEPNLSTVAAVCVGARPGAIQLKKAGLVRVDFPGRIDAGAGVLRWLLSPGWLARSSRG